MTLPGTDVMNIITAKLIFGILSRLLPQRGSPGAEIFLHFLKLLYLVTDCEESLGCYQVLDIVKVFLEIYS